MPASASNAGRPDLQIHKRAARRVFFDGGCPICRREIAWYQTRRGAEAIDWVDIDSEPVPPGLNRQALLSRFTVERGDHIYASGAEGFIALWRAIPATRWFGRLVDHPPGRFVLERAYRGFLVLRRLWRRQA
ncbi:MAG: DUF393 domain-containing protein [Pseudomonadota bacterium]